MESSQSTDREIWRVEDLAQSVAPETVADPVACVLEQLPDVIVHGEVENLPATLNEAQGSGN